MTLEGDALHLTGLALIKLNGSKNSTSVLGIFEARLKFLICTYLINSDVKLLGYYRTVVKKQFIPYTYEIIFALSFSRHPKALLPCRNPNYYTVIRDNMSQWCNLDRVGFNAPLALPVALQSTNEGVCFFVYFLFSIHI